MTTSIQLTTDGHSSRRHNDRKATHFSSWLLLEMRVDMPVG